MTQKYWHKMSAACKKCDDRLTLVAVYYSADGQIKLDWVCIRCGIESYTTSELVECVLLAHNADLEQSFVETPV